MVRLPKRRKARTQTHTYIYRHSDGEWTSVLHLSPCPHPIASIPWTPFVCATLTKTVIGQEHNATLSINKCCCQSHTHSFWTEAWRTAFGNQNDDTANRASFLSLLGSMATCPQFSFACSHAYISVWRTCEERGCCPCWLGWVGLENQAFCGEGEWGGGSGETEERKIHYETTWYEEAVVWSTLFRTPTLWCKNTPTKVSAIALFIGLERRRRGKSRKGTPAEEGLCEINILHINPASSLSSFTPVNVTELMVDQSKE